MSQLIQCTGSTFCHHTIHILMRFLIQKKYFLTDVIIHVIKINTIFQVFIMILYLTIQLPIYIPIFSHCHSYKHNPTE